MDTPPDALLSEGAARRAARMATPRMRREQETMVAMLRMYCRDHDHAIADRADGLCDGCGALLDYSLKRLAGCPFGAEKPTCANCAVHCYGPRQREQTRVVMRHAGPRMLLRHPLLAISHLLDGRRPSPPKPRGKLAAGREGSATAAGPAAESHRGFGAGSGVGPDTTARPAGTHAAEPR